MGTCKTDKLQHEPSQVLPRPLVLPEGFFSDVVGHADSHCGNSAELVNMPGALRLPDTTYIIC